MHRDHVAQRVAGLDLAAIGVLHNLADLQHGRFARDHDHGRLVAVAVVPVSVGQLWRLLLAGNQRLIADRCRTLLDPHSETDGDRYAWCDGTEVHLNA